MAQAASPVCAIPAVTPSVGVVLLSLSSKASTGHIGGGGGGGSQRPLLVLHTSVPLHPAVAQPGTQLPASQTVLGGLQAASAIHGGGATGSQRPVAALHAVEPVHCRPPGAAQPGTHWPLSHTELGAIHCASMLQGPATCWQRPVLVLHTVPPPQLGPPTELQPGVQAPASHTAAGAPHAPSLAQGGGGGGPQRPVVALHTVSPAQAGAPTSAQPGTHRPASQISRGGAQPESVVQAGIPASQRPVVGLHTSTPEQVRLVPAVAQPGTQACCSQICPPPHSGSARQPAAASGVITFIILDDAERAQ